MQFAEKEVIMPLSETGDEIANIPEAVTTIIDNLSEIRNVALEASKAKRIVLVGSGESFVVAKIAATYFSIHCEIKAEAVQALEYNTHYYPHSSGETLVIILTSSGRPSPIMDALELAIKSDAKTLLITNDAKNWNHSSVANYHLSTYAVKKGMPTQSTVCTLTVLLCLASFWQKQLPVLGFVNELIDIPSRLNETLELVSDSSIDRLISQESSDKHGWSCLGTGYGAYVAETMANLLACGLMKESNAMPLEEYHHSLRMFLPQKDKRIVIFEDASQLSKFVIHTIKELLAQEAILILVHHSNISKQDFASHKNLISIHYQTDNIISKEQKVLHQLVIAQKMAFLLAANAVKKGLIRARFLG